MKTLPRLGLAFPWTVVLAVLLVLPLTPLQADQPVRIAVLGLENLNRDPRYDYLEGMIIGVLLYDLIRSDSIELVERSRMDRILDEQNLRLMGILSDQDTAVQLGQLAGADALVEGNYAFLGRELIINLSLMTVNNGTTTPFTARGSTENTIHGLAEEIIKSLTGKTIILTGSDGERSLLSLSDEEPGSIEFFCNFQQGEIFVDGEFYGYTPGGTTPTLLEDLSPGEHEIRVEAGNNFGEIEWPEIIFKDWQRTVNVTAGRKSVVRANIGHFNGLIYDAMYIFRKNWRIEKDDFENIDIVEDISYQDRSGRLVPVIYSMTARRAGENLKMMVTISADGEEFTWNIDENEDSVEFREQAGIVLFDFEKDWYSNSYWDIDVWIQRTDIYQGLHQEELQ